MDLYKLHSDPTSLEHNKDAGEYVPKLVWNKFSLNLDTLINDESLRKRWEPILANDPYTAFLYAKLVLKGPFPAGEAAIAKDTFFAYNYVDGVLKTTFPAGEAAIGKDPWFAYWYVKYFLKGPFPAGEAAIGKNPLNAFWYARHILNGPFPAGEKAIMASENREKYLELVEIARKKAS